MDAAIRVVRAVRIVFKTPMARLAPYRADVSGGAYRAVARHRGAAARRAADRMDPIEVVFDDPSGGRERIVGRVQPPQRDRGDFAEIEFNLRELT